MDRFDSLGDDRDRRARYAGAVLATEPDVVLQTIVAEAAAAAGTPIALVSLVLHRLQVFRAHVGLPPELDAAPATDRCASFCQLVVRDRTPLLVVDATTDGRVPRMLVDTLGIRAYYGVPLMVDGAVLGTLCVLDTVAREITPDQRAAVDRLAPAATARLVELVAEAPGQDRVLAVQAAGDLLRTSFAHESAELAMARIAATELRVRMRALDRAAVHEGVLALSRDATRALDDLDAALGRLETGAREQRAVLGVLFNSLDRRPIELREALQSAAVLVRARVRWSAPAIAGAPAAARATLIVSLATALVALAGEDGAVIAARALAVEDALELRLRPERATPIPEVALDASALPGATLRVDGDELVIVLPRAP